MKTRQFIIEDTVDIAISDNTIGPTLPIKGMNNYNSVITTANTARVPLEMNIRYPMHSDEAEGVELYESIIVSYKVRNGNNTNARHDEANLNDARIHTGETPSYFDMLS